MLYITRHIRQKLLFNLHLAYKYSPQLRFSVDVMKLFDRKASDIDYYYASQLRSEASPVSDLHSHPTERRTVRFGMRVVF